MTTPARPTPQHTPLPWRMGDSPARNEREKGEEHWPIFWPDCGCCAHVFKKEDAELIVQSVNALPALAAARLALEAVKKTIETSEHWWMDSPNKGGFDLDAIDAALALLRDGGGV